MNRPAIVIVDQDAIDTFPSEVARILSAVGHPEALVTDESQVWDFTIHVEGAENDPDIVAHNRKISDGLDELMGRTVAGREYLWLMAQELHQKAQPCTRH